MIMKTFYQLTRSTGDSVDGGDKNLFDDDPGAPSRILTTYIS